MLHFLVFIDFWTLRRKVGTCVQFVKKNFACTLTEGGKSQPIKPTPGLPGAQSGAAGGLLAIVATVGGILFVCNLCLLYCYVKRRAGKQLLGKLTNLYLLLRLTTPGSSSHAHPVGVGGARGAASDHHCHRRHRWCPPPLLECHPALLFCQQQESRGSDGHTVRGWVLVGFATNTAGGLLLTLPSYSDSTTY